jgi:hypothetical protein
MALFEGSSPTPKRGAVTLSAVAAAVLLTASAGGCHRSTAADLDTQSTFTVAEGDRVTYSVTSDGPIASVSYRDTEGDVSTDLDVGDGWTGAARMPTPSTQPAISAVPGAGSTRIRCIITVGDRVVDERTSVGNPPGKVVCGGSVTAAKEPLEDTTTGPVVETDIVDPPNHAGR